MRLPHPHPLLAPGCHHRLLGLSVDAFDPGCKHTSISHFLPGKTDGQLDYESARRITQVHPDHAVNKGDDQGCILKSSSRHTYHVLDSHAIDAQDYA